MTQKSLDVQYVHLAQSPELHGPVGDQLHDPLSHGVHPGGSERVVPDAAVGPDTGADSGAPGPVHPDIRQLLGQGKDVNNTLDSGRDAAPAPLKLLLPPPAPQHQPPASGDSIPMEQWQWRQPIPEGSEDSDDGAAVGGISTALQQLHGAHRHPGESGTEHGGQGAGRGAGGCGPGADGSPGDPATGPGDSEGDPGESTRAGQAGGRAHRGRGDASQEKKKEGPERNKMESMEGLRRSTLRPLRPPRFIPRRDRRLEVK